MPVVPAMKSFVTRLMLLICNDDVALRACVDARVVPIGSEGMSTTKWARPKYQAPISLLIPGTWGISQVLLGKPI